MRCLIIHNMQSGFGSSAIFDFERALVRDGDECVLRLLDKNQSAKECLKDAESFDLVVVSGGDGTVASLLYELKNREILTCVFPSGTACLYCINLGNSAEPQALAQACRIGRVAHTDLGEISFVDTDGKTHVRGFTIMMGTGFDAQIMQKALSKKKTLGETAYLAAALSDPQPPIHHFSIEIDGRTIERDGISCLIANNATIQANLSFDPSSNMADGLLEVIVLEQTNTIDFIKPLVASIFDPEGKTLGRPQIETFSGKHIRIFPAEPVPLEYDGELFDGLVKEYEAHVLPAANRMIVDSLSKYHDEDDRFSAENPRFGKAETKAFPDLF